MNERLLFPFQFHLANGVPVTVMRHPEDGYLITSSAAPLGETGATPRIALSLLKDSLCRNNPLLAWPGPRANSVRRPVPGCYVWSVADIPLATLYVEPLNIRRMVLYYGNGKCVSGKGSTAQAAYRAACREMRLVRHDVARLLYQKARLRAYCRRLARERRRGDLQPDQRRATDLEAAVMALIERASTESMALRHLIGTKEPLAALDVLVNEAIKAQGLGLAEFRAQQSRREIEEVMRGQRRLQKELDELRAQLAAAKAEPDEEAKPGPGETVQDSAQAPPEASAPTETGGETPTPAPTQEVQQ